MEIPHSLFFGLRLLIAGIALVLVFSIALITTAFCLGRRRRTLLYLGVKRWAFRHRRNAAPPSRTIQHETEEEEEGIPDEDALKEA